MKIKKLLEDQAPQSNPRIFAEKCRRFSLRMLYAENERGLKSSAAKLQVGKR
jgi:hypothetical protein